MEDLGVLETDTDIMEMAKRMVTRTQVEGRVLLGMVIIKQLQTLVWWVRDQQKHGLVLVATNFDAATMNQAGEMKNLRHELANMELLVTDLGKFDPDDFDAHEDAFLNLLAQSFGALRKPLRFVVHLDSAPAEFAMNKEQQMYQFPLTGRSFELDNQAVIGSSRHF